MCALFRNRFRNETSRHKGFCYSNPGGYFVTICTKDNLNHFGDVIDGQMILSVKGKIASDLWLQIPMHFSWIILDEYSIMPNHIHGIIILKSNCRDVACNVRTIGCNNDSDIPGSSKNENMSMISPKSGSLGSVIRSYKSAVSREIHMIDQVFSWHSRFYDHIIRTDKEFCRIRKYIQENPNKWH